MDSAARTLVSMVNTGTSYAKVDPQEMDKESQQQMDGEEEQEQTELEEVDQKEIVNVFYGNENFEVKMALDGEGTEVFKSEFPPIDTTATFDRVFQGKDKFDSWEEFVSLFEEFQKQSLTFFKPRSGTHVSYANEKRVTHKIPDRFVYQKVKLICKHYGIPRIGDTPRQNHRYVGLGCNALVSLSYKKGHLHISERCLIHNNHDIEPPDGDIDSKIKKIRPIAYNDELDLMVAKTADQCQVFTHKKAEYWQDAIKRLKDADKRFEHMTQRMLKKRLQFLMDRYEENSDGLPPLSDDYLGIILHRLIDARQKAKDSVRHRKRRGPGQSEVDDDDDEAEDSSARRKRTVRKPVRYRVAGSYEEYIQDRKKFCKNRNTGYDDDDDDDYNPEEDEDIGMPEEPPNFMDSMTGSEELAGPSFGMSASSSTIGSTATVERALSSFLKYLHSRDSDERKIRQREMVLRKEEIQMRKREMEAHRYEMDILKEKFEYERAERQQLIELLKQQTQLANQGRVRQGIQTENGETMDIIVLSDREVEQIAQGKTTVHIEER